MHKNVDSKKKKSQRNTRQMANDCLLQNKHIKKNIDLSCQHRPNRVKTLILSRCRQGSSIVPPLDLMPLSLPLRKVGIKGD